MIHVVLVAGLFFNLVAAGSSYVAYRMVRRLRRQLDAALRQNGRLQEALRAEA